MSGEPEQDPLPKWVTNILIGAAGICLLLSLWLALNDRVAAGTLTAGLFVVCVLFHYMPRMESFKAWGIEAKWRAVVTETKKAFAKLTPH
jgi:hypothetical protein